MHASVPVHTWRKRHACPKCFSRDVLRSRWRWPDTLLIIFGMAAFRCYHCNRRFYDFLESFS